MKLLLIAMALMVFTFFITNYLIKCSTLIVYISCSQRKLIDKIIAKANAGKVSTTSLVNLVYDFCEIYSSVSFYPYQKQFSKRLIRSVLTNDGEEITALFSRQSGKSETVATTVGGMMILLPRLAHMPCFADDIRLQRFKDGLWVGIFAPTMRQAQITYNRLKKRISCKSAQAIFADQDFGYDFSTSNGQTVAITNGSFATCISASEGSNIEGESFKLIICEECQDISNYKIRKSIHPMGASYNATIIKIGTATTFKGDFYEAIERNKIRDHSRKGIRNHYEYNYEIVQKYNPDYAKYIEREKYRLGEDSDEFQMAYNLKWILSSGMFIDIEKLFDKCGMDIDLVASDKINVHVAGIDLGGTGGDSTIITILEVDWDNPVISEEKVNPKTGEAEIYRAYEVTLKAWYELQGEYEQQYPLIIEALSNFKLAKLTIDATRESSVAQRIKANVPFEVEPFVFSSKSKSDLYKYLDSELKCGRVHLPNSKKTQETREYKAFVQQMESLQKSYSGSYLVVSHPPERGAHDDYPDSLALAVWASREESNAYKIETKQVNPFLENTTNKVYYKSVNRYTSRRR